MVKWFPTSSVGYFKKEENPILECKQTSNRSNTRSRDDCNLWGQYFFCWFLMVCGCEKWESKTMFYICFFVLLCTEECHVKDNKIAKKGRNFITFYYSCSMEKINSLNILEAFLNHRIRMVCAASMVRWSEGNRYFHWFWLLLEAVIVCWGFLFDCFAFWFDFCFHSQLCC